MDQIGRIERIVSPALQGMGYELVRVQITGGHRPTLQIMAERPDGGQITIDDCAEISRALSAVLDVEDPVSTAYVLEVSSPGIDRPLTRRKDYERFAGFEARVETREPVGGRKRFKGRLRGLSGDDIRIETEEGELAVPLEAVHRAKLLLTDELIAATAQH